MLTCREVVERVYRNYLDYLCSVIFKPDVISKFKINKLEKEHESSLALT
jgi:hypothetical protein